MIGNVADCCTYSKTHELCLNQILTHPRHYKCLLKHEILIKQQIDYVNYFIYIDKYTNVSCSAGAYANTPNNISRMCNAYN